VFFSFRELATEFFVFLAFYISRAFVCKVCSFHFRISWPIFAKIGMNFMAVEDTPNTLSFDLLHRNT